MKSIVTFLLLALLAGCASAPLSDAPARPFHDHLFAPPSETISASGVFALSEPMQHYLKTTIAPELRRKGDRQGLLEALYDKQQLRLEYDAVRTRTAAEAFEARAGNCLSLVIMTAAFARALDLPVYYNQVFVEDTWSRSGDLHFLIGHVNLMLGRRLSVASTSVSTTFNENAPITIDFVRPSGRGRSHIRDVAEHTIIAMYMNNRAAEALEQGSLNDAYWWAREAIMQDPRFTAAYNTIGVIYRRSGHLPEAVAVMRDIVQREPDNLHTINNLALALNESGQAEEARALHARLRQLEPIAPFHHFELGLEALKNSDFKAAIGHFENEAKRDAYYHEVHFWLAYAHMGLKEPRQAMRHLNLAIENSTTEQQKTIYTAKLERVRSYAR